MPLRDLPLKLLTFIALAASLTVFLYPAPLAMTFLTPCCVIALYQLPRSYLTLYCLFIGFFLDTFSFSPDVWWHSAGFGLTGFLLYPLTRYFFPDRLTTLPIMTMLFSSLATAITGFSKSLTHFSYFHPLSWVQYDLLVFPVLDAAAAFLLIQLPYLLLKGLPRRGKDYFHS